MAIGLRDDVEMSSDRVVTLIREILPWVGFFGAIWPALRTPMWSLLTIVGGFLSIAVLRFITDKVARSEAALGRASHVGIQMRWRLVVICLEATTSLLMGAYGALLASMLVGSIHS